MINIIGHSVAVKNIELLQFMYPEFKIIDKPIMIATNPIIFTGETKYINQIKSLGVPYIIVAAMR